MSARYRPMLLLGPFASTSVLNYGYGLAMSWLLSPGDFGLLAFAQTVLLVAGLVLNSGFTYGLSSALVQAEQGQRAALARGALAANLLLSLVIGAALLGLFALGPLRAGFETSAVAVLVVAALPAVAVIAVVRAVAQASEQFVLAGMLALAEVAGKVLAGVLFVRGGTGAQGAVAGWATGSALAALPAVWLLAGRFSCGLRGPLVWPSLQRAGALFGALLGFTLLINLDPLALKLLGASGRAQVGQYQAALVLANTPYYVAAALMPVLYTKIARLNTLGQSGPLAGRALRLALLVFIPLELGLAALPDAALRLCFPDTYAGAAGPLRLLALGNCAVILIAILSAVFQAGRRAGTPLRVFALLLPCELAALWVAVPRWHMLGAAAVFLAATTTVLAALVWEYGRALPRAVVAQGTRWCVRYSAALAVFLLMWCVWNVAARG